MSFAWARWHGPFETANQAALIVAVCAIAGLWLFRTRPQRAMQPLGMALFGFSVIALAATQSRAGALALIIGITVLRFWGVVTTRVALLSASIALSVMLFWPGGGARALVAVEDAVHGERPILAHAALSLIWDHAIVGTGRKFSEILNMWYLPASLEDRFRSALNDYLTLLGHVGIPLASLLLSGVLTLIIAAWRFARGPTSALIVAILSIHLTCGFFQAHLWYALTCITFLASLLSLAITIGVYRTKTGPRTRLRWFLPATMLVAWLICISLTAFGSWMSAIRHPTATSFHDGEVVARSRHAIGRAEQGVLICVDDPGNSKIFRRSVAYFALLDGWTACISPEANIVLASLRENPPGEIRTIVVASREMGLSVWENIRSNPVMNDVILFDPVDVPERGSSSISDGRAPAQRAGRTLIVVRPSAPFVPPDDVLRREVESDNPRSGVLSLSKGVSDQEAWALMSQFLQHVMEQP